MSSHVAYIRKQLFRIIVEAPFHRRWTKAIQSVIPNSERSNSDGIWYFDLKWHEAVHEITIEYYVHVSSRTRPSNPSPGGWRERWDRVRWTPYEPEPLSSHTGDYSILFLRDNAPIEVVKAAYKALVKIHHPDAGGDEETFIQIDEAYKRIING